MLENREGVVIEKGKKSVFMLFLVIVILSIAAFVPLITSFWYLYLAICNGYPIFSLSFLFVFLFPFGIGIFCLSIEYAVLLQWFAKYEITEVGVVVKYPMESRKVVQWDEFQQVCVCYTNYTTRGEPMANTVICFVKKGEKTDLYGRWKANSPFHYRSVITLDYTTRLYEEVKEKCPNNVLDLRKTRTYRL